MSIYNNEMSSKNCIYQSTCKKYITNEDCECKSKEIECIRVFKIRNLMRKTLLTEKQMMPITLIMSPQLPDYNSFVELSALEKSIVKFVQGGGNLYIYSEICGNGKTSWAIRLLQSYIERTAVQQTLDECHALFIHVPKYILESKNNITEPSSYYKYVRDNVLTADLVIWDEVSYKSATEYEKEQILSLISERLNLGKANIYTSNVEDGDLKNHLGPRLHSRIFNGSRIIHFTTRDKRGESIH